MIRHVEDRGLTWMTTECSSRNLFAYLSQACEGRPLEAQVINDSLNLDSLNTALDPGDDRAPAGGFTITASFSNISGTFFEVATLTATTRFSTPMKAMAASVPE